jgi:geranyl-CoA carboxylase alpha subunit
MSTNSTVRRNDEVKRFGTVLIANRGEIAMRVIRTARSMGLRTVAVYSAADAAMPHVAAADKAVMIGPAPAAQSYLNIDALLDAARRAGADAVHPGYGFLSENAAFAEACGAANLVFVGPPSEAIRLMADKALAKRIMLDAGVACIPGYDGEDQSPARFAREADRIGYPVMIKAVAGGGGKGIRLVGDRAELMRGLELARSEALKSFANGSLMLEKALIAPRHIEVQIFADAHGSVVHLGDRDCSVQRRHQKVLEEAPAPGLSDELRAAMGDAAVRAARAVTYLGAGTIEFLLDAEGRFYFLEMNTRLQVEHPVTELTTGLDLVQWQFLVAAGEALPLAQDQIVHRGHAIEARLYAEDPAADFLPQSGTLRAWRPATGAGIRVDHGLVPGASISTFYDPMLAKVIGFGPDRRAATRWLARGLEDSVISGLPTNRTFLLDCIATPDFQAARLSTAFIERNMPVQPERSPPSAQSMAIAAVLLHERAARRQPLSMRNWRSSGSSDIPFNLRIGDQHCIVRLAVEDDLYEVRVRESTTHIRVVEPGELTSRMEIDGVNCDVQSVWWGDEVDVFFAGRNVLASLWTDDSEMDDEGGNASARAPMPGVVVSVHVAQGDIVAKGDLLLVMEAMKMETRILAPAAGKILALACRPGQQVPLKHVLAEIEPITG